MRDRTHPADCGLCADDLPGEHVYVDPATMARRAAAKAAAADRLHDAWHAIRAAAKNPPPATCSRCDRAAAQPATC